VIAAARRRSERPARMHPAWCRCAGCTRPGPADRRAFGGCAFLLLACPIAAALALLW